MDAIQWYLPVSEAAELLECHRRDVLRLLDQGRFSFIRMPGSGIRISETSLRDFLRFSVDGSPEEYNNMDTEEPPAVN
ncbi:MAG: helix-turn-helix domain-containing protein [Desulfobacteraceae bacterium]|nr:helix-turn-helix domain-containing protein [Desulfobacteraceae bacterium]